MPGDWSVKQSQQPRKFNGTSLHTGAQAHMHIHTHGLACADLPPSTASSTPLPWWTAGRQRSLQQRSQPSRATHRSDNWRLETRISPLITSVRVTIIHSDASGTLDAYALAWQHRPHVRRHASAQVWCGCGGSPLPTPMHEHQHHTPHHHQSVKLALY